MISKILLAAASIAVIGTLSASAIAGSLPFPQYDQLGRSRAAGEDPTFHVNRYGYGNYVQGPNGSIGGYPAGSDGARELEINHELQCRYMPESC